jgi:hypothetical protein
MVERLRGTIRQRSKIMQGLDDLKTAQTMMDGLRIYYNFLTPHGFGRKDSSGSVWDNGQRREQMENSDRECKQKSLKYFGI